MDSEMALLTAIQSEILMDWLMAQQTDPLRVTQKVPYSALVRVNGLDLMLAPLMAIQLGQGFGSVLLMVLWLGHLLVQDNQH